jgi:hypothetical protein
MVDFAYEMKVLNRQDGQMYSAIGLVEMKDWKKDLSEGDIVQILRRIPFSEYSLLTTGHFWGRCKLHFIFCRSFNIADKSKSLEKNVEGQVKNMTCLPSRGFSRRGNPLKEDMDSETYRKFVMDQKILNSQKKNLNRKLRKCHRDINSETAKDNESFSEEKLQKLEEKKQKIIENSRLLNNCYDYYDEEYDIFKLEETEEEIAKDLMPPENSSLSDLFEKQKMNLYFVKESKSSGMYDLKEIYENPSHDLISIIIPLQKSMAHMGDSLIKIEDVLKYLKDLNESNDDTLGLSVHGKSKSKTEDFHCYLSNELTEAITKPYIGTHIDGETQSDSALIGVLRNLQVTTQQDSDSDNGASVPPKYPKFN